MSKLSDEQVVHKLDIDLMEFAGVVLKESQRGKIAAIMSDPKVYKKIVDQFWNTKISKKAA